MTMTGARYGVLLSLSYMVYGIYLLTLQCDSLIFKELFINARKLLVC